MLADRLSTAGVPSQSGLCHRRVRELRHGSSQKNVAQRLLVHAASDRNISTIPQPRKPSQTIIAVAIMVASKPITTFLLIGLDEDRALILAPCMSTGWRLFIRLPLISERSINATNDVGNLMDELT
jgi:hypothetical protein